MKKIQRAASIVGAISILSLLDMVKSNLAWRGKITPTGIVNPMSFSLVGDVTSTGETSLTVKITRKPTKNDSKGAISK
jgi:hypothetical protein